MPNIKPISGYEAEKTLLDQLEHGRRSAEERGTLTTEQLRARLADHSAKGE